MSLLKRTIAGGRTSPHGTWQLASVVCASLAILIAAVNLIGWLSGSRLMTAWIADIAPMKVSGSLAVIAIAIPMLRISWRRRIHRIDRILLPLAATVSLIAGLYGVGFSVLERIRAGSLNLPAPVVELVVNDPFRIPIASGVSFLLFAAALALIQRDWVRGTCWSSGLALAAAANSVLTLFGYTYGVPGFYEERFYVPMPLAIAVAFLLLSVVFSTSHPRTGIFAVILSDTRAGATARLLIPLAIAIPFSIGLVHVYLVRTGLVGEQFAVAMNSTLIAAIFGGAILAHATRIDRLDRRAERYRASFEEEIENRRLLWEHSNDLLCVAGYDGFFKQLNPAWERRLGWSRGVLLDQPFLNLVHPDDREHTEREAARISEGHDTIGFTNRYRTSDGTYRTLQWVSSSRPERKQIHAIARDVTEMMEARERILNLNRELEIRVKMRTRELEAANRELESFSYAVSHDLRAPLRAIEGFSRIVLDRYAEELPDEGQHFLQRVRAGATKMAELIDGILKLSRLNRAELNIQRVDLSAMATDIVHDLRSTSPDRHVDVEIEPGLEVEADPALTRSLLINLIGNAWKFTSRTENPRIEIGSAPGTESQFFVRDNGAGFDPHHAEKLFSPFQRLHTTEEFDGTGLGLATVQRVVNRHGGSAWAEGEPGNGATLWFSLPGAQESRSQEGADSDLFHTGRPFRGKPEGASQPEHFVPNTFGPAAQRARQGRMETNQ